jgi:tellurite resistance protein TerC
MKGTPVAIDVPFWAWLVLGAVVIVSLGVDLVGHRGKHGASRKAAVLWSAAWISVALAFTAWMGLQFGGAAAVEFGTAYLLEKSLSVDNLFVFLIVFATLEIPEAEQHRVLFWGIFGALVTRGLFIAAGSAMLAAWHGVLYVMGGFLLFTAIRTLRAPQKEASEGKLVSFARRHLPFTPKLVGHHFITVENGRRVVTPLFLALVVIEVTDVIFAIDSIPAVFAVSTEPFIVYSSNILAILGLRALFLVLAGLLERLAYLRFGLAAILAFAGGKMLLSGVLHIPALISIAIIAAILAATVIASLTRRPGHTPDGPSHGQRRHA